MGLRVGLCVRARASKSRRGKLLMSSRGVARSAGAMGDRGVMHAGNNSWSLCRNGSRGETARMSGEIGEEDKIICLWSITDLYLFEGTSMRKSKTSATTNFRLKREYSWKKMKAST